MPGQDAVGLDVQALDTIQHDILTLYKPPAVQTVGADGMPSHEAIGDSIAGLCSVSIVSALYKATGQLLDDLNRNVRLLSTPERWALCPTSPGCSPSSGLLPYPAVTNMPPCTCSLDQLRAMSKVYVRLAQPSMALASCFALFSRLLVSL